FFFLNTVYSYIYTLSLHDALPISLNILTNKQYEILIDLNIQIAQIIQKKLAEHGFDLYDIKLEFGYVNHPDNIILIDEISGGNRSEEHTSELQSRFDLVCRLLLEK